MKILASIIVLFVLIQFIPITRDNPHVDSSKEMAMPQNVKEILQKSCFDCHSNETKYSIYSKIAPLSWGVRKHIKEGREVLNFSTWKDMDPKIKKMRVDRFAKVIELGFMPLRSYLMFHDESKMTQEEEKILITWANTELKQEVEAELAGAKNLSSQDGS